MSDKESRIAYIIELYQAINPDSIVTRETEIKNTSIERICETDGGPYQRIRAWCESKKPRIVRFSGVKDEFPTGATRDQGEGKGRYDLISPLFLKRMARVLEEGAKNHGANNWKKGLPYSRTIDSVLRHTNQFREGLIDEDHLAHAAVNIMFLLHFEEEGRSKELNDLQQ